MCGIWCSIGTEQSRKPSEELRTRLQRRGPDAFHHLEIPVLRDGAPNLYLSFYATVLSLRGTTVVPQPHYDVASGSLLCWNGEAWHFDGSPISGNDTAFIFKQFLKACTKDTEDEKSSETLLAHLSLVRGPFAFLFYDGMSKRLWFGRDCLGRRSLLFSSQNDQFVLSSVGDGLSANLWAEVEADGFYMADFTSPGGMDNTFPVPTLNFSTTRIPFSSLEAVTEARTYTASPFVSFNKTIPDPVPQPLTLSSPSVDELESLLTKSLHPRLSSIPDLPRVVSEGPGSCRLAILFSGGLDCSVLARMSSDILPADEPIDLLNVAFENPRLAKNVPNSQTSIFDLCPDRLTARSSIKELRETCPARDWRLVEINIPFIEFKAHRTTIISLMSPHNTEMDLSIAAALYFAARGRGYVAQSSGERTEYHSAARVLLSGLGADELFGGYQRHATAFIRQGYRGLIDELELDFSRLGKRNLGRDDRATSHWSREVRFPFLDEELVNWALATPLEQKCGFGQPEVSTADVLDDEKWTGIEPGKKVLRLLAWRLGLRGVAMEKKRAIQFGARTAKMEASKTKGTHVIKIAD